VVGHGVGHHVADAERVLEGRPPGRDLRAPREETGVGEDEGRLVPEARQREVSAPVRTTSLVGRRETMLRRIWSGRLLTRSTPLFGPVDHTAATEAARGA
jgi:hypothetical protein